MTQRLFRSDRQLGGSAFLLASTCLAMALSAGQALAQTTPAADAGPQATSASNPPPTANGAQASVPTGAALPAGAGSNDASTDSRGAGGLAEIIVTARRVAENLQTTPISISAFSPQTLQQLGIKSLNDLQNYTPNLTLTEGNGGNAAVFIRGVGQSDFIISEDPGVGTYVDGVYIARQFGSLFDTLDLHQVEVLRGPQGTLFGRNTEGGAINLVTTRPKFNETSGSVDLSYGTRNRIDGQAIINVPLGDNVAARFAASSRTQDGYIHNYYLDKDFGNTNRQMLRGSVLARVNDKLQFFLSGDYYRQRERGAVYNLVNIGYHPNTPGAFDARFGLYNQYIADPQNSPRVDNEWVSGPRTSNSAGGDNDSNADNWGVNLTGTLNLGNAELKSISAYRGVKAYGNNDNDGTPAAAWENPYHSREWQVSQEFQLTGHALDNRLHYTGGLYYFHEEGHDFELAGFPFGLYAALYPLPNYSVPAPGYASLSCPNYTPPAGQTLGTYCWGGSAPDTIAAEIGAFLPGPYDTTRRTQNSSLAGYGQASFDFTRKLSLTLGGRVSYESKRGHYDDLFPNIAPGVDRITIADGHQHWTIPTWLGTLGYKASDDLYAYLTISRGFKAGGINTRPIPGATVLNTYDPEYNDNYELGLKTEMFNHHVRLNGDVFFDNYKDIQFFNLAYDPTTGGFNSQIVNPADARIYGTELEATLVLSRRLTINGNFAYKHFRYRNIAADAPVTVSLGYLPTNQPNTTFNVGANYRLPIDESNEIAGRVNVSWRDRTPVAQQLDEFNQPFEVNNPSFALVTLDLTYRNIPNNFEFYVHVDNLFNQSYLLAYANNVGLESELWNKPREWRAGVRLRF